MSNGTHAGTGWTVAVSDWITRAVSALLLIGLGVALGFQYMAPDKRVLSVLAGIVVAGIAWRLEIVAGIGMAILALPIPKGLSFGTTNLALVLLLVVIYLLRVGQRLLPRPVSTPLNGPIAGLFIAYVLSFTNVASEDVGLALANSQLFVATLLLFVVVTNSVQSEADLRRLHTFQALTLVMLSLLAFWELANPGRALVPGWLDFTRTTGEVFNTRNVRIGGTFYDYELLADFCGLNVLFLAFLLVQARDVVRRTLIGLLLAATVFILFSTVTRGPIFSLSAAVLYMMWIMRRRLRVVPLTIGAATVTAAFLGANFLVANFTTSGNLFERLSQTEVHGFVPDTRAAAWASAWDHFLLHPLIGCGPYYSSRHGLNLWFWPHDLYLYVLNIVGILGFGFFAWMLWRLFVVTKPRVDTPASSSYLESYIMMARVQLVFFLVDQIKIEYLRNATYPFQVWLMFALWVAADRLRKQEWTAAPLARA